MDKDMINDDLVGEGTLDLNKIYNQPNITHNGKFLYHM
jgi:hypothetical protein